MYAVVNIGCIEVWCFIEHSDVRGRAVSAARSAVLHSKDTSTSQDVGYSYFTRLSVTPNSYYACQLTGF
jgi:hypothetical protein